MSMCDAVGEEHMQLHESASESAGAAVLSQRSVAAQRAAARTETPVFSLWLTLDQRTSAADGSGAVASAQQLACCHNTLRCRQVFDELTFFQ